MSANWDSLQQRVFRFIKEQTGHNNMLTVPYTFLTFCGDLQCAVFLAQMIYWADKGKRRDGWIFKSAGDWYRETMLSEYHVRRCERKLKEMGVLKVKKMMANGSSTNHYKIDEAALKSLFVQHLNS